MMMMMIYHFQLDNVRSDVCVWMRVCVCVCVCYQCVSVGKQDHSVLQLPSDETQEQYQNDQVNTLKLYPLKDSIKQIMFEDILTITGVEPCMFYGIIAVFVKYNGRWNAA